MAANDHIHSPRTLPIESTEASLELAGGKGTNLSRLARAGFSVPDGFIITTQAYGYFVSYNHLEASISAALPLDGLTDPTALENASTHIRSCFSTSDMPADLGEEILAVYLQAGKPAVAVRSSATAEDLPGMSFAGQQDTFLNIVGESSLLDAVVACWSSLWTGRAIGYRARNHIPQMGVSLAVVVQKMVDSQVSGVLFTANPLTGLRTETVVDAVYGLGEALVSGQVQPDHYVIHSASGQVIKKKAGMKTISIQPKPGGGTMTSAETGEQGETLREDQLRVLNATGQKIEKLYDFPQDIEFAWKDDDLYILQSRAVTSLYPVPEGMQAEPLQVLVSFGAVQGMLDPITPLGQDFIRGFGAIGSHLFGGRATNETQSVFITAGERLWLNITSIVRNSVGRRVAAGALGAVEPAVRNLMPIFIDDPRLNWTRTGISRKSLIRLMRFFGPVAVNMIFNMIAPVKRRKYILKTSETTLEKMQQKLNAIEGNRWSQLLQAIDILDDITRELPGKVILFISGVASGIAPFYWLNMLAKNLPQVGDVPWKDRILEITRGQAHNPTSEMDLNLWRISQAIKQDPQSFLAFQESSPQELGHDYLDGKAPVVIQKEIAEFLDRYGQRGLAEIDIGRIRWSEDPAHIFEVLNSFLGIAQSDQSPDAVFARGAFSAQAALKGLCEALSSSPNGWLKKHLARIFTKRVWELMGLRESPKFFIVRMLGYLRQALLKIGREFVAAGELNAPDDLVFLTFAEIKQFASKEKKDWKGLVAQRRESYRRELARSMIPRILLSDGRVFYDGMSPSAANNGASMVGDPVSPGCVEGLVRVVMDPRQAHIQSGEIMVCPGTDPSWTPLFLTASGLVMEVGGMMTHGAVVAREYGIPAIVGVDRATTRLKTGQRIRIDGSTGAIIILDM